MISKIKILILSLSALFIFAAPILAPVVATAACNPSETDPNAADYCSPVQTGVCYGANNLQISENPSGSCPSGTSQTDKVNSLISDVINVFSVIVGIVAVIMIIVGGFHYITSGGSDEKVKKAKNTILYAIIGLVVVALAQIIVKFVLNKATS